VPLSTQSKLLTRPLFSKLDLNIFFGETLLASLGHLDSHERLAEFLIKFLI
jgi:hypothetical protein